VGSLKKVPSEGGSGGGRGHSSMEHWAESREIKDAARRVRRPLDRQEASDGLIEHEDNEIPAVQ
jgi:hypothetical protein